MNTLLASCERRRYATRSIVVTQGQLSRDLFVLVGGSVSLRRLTPSGHELVLGQAHAGDLFGEAGLFESDTPNDSSVRAKSTCDIARISHARLRAHPALLNGALHLLAPQLALRVERLTRRVAQMAFYDTQQRVAQALRDLSAMPDAHFHADGRIVVITRIELAAIAGASREVVGRVLVRLQEEGMIHVRGRVIVVLHAGASGSRHVPLRSPVKTVRVPVPSYSRLLRRR